MNNRYASEDQEDVRKGLVNPRRIYHWLQMYSDLIEMCETLGGSPPVPHLMALMSALQAARALAGEMGRKPT